MTTTDLSPTEYLPYFSTYINKAANLELFEGMAVGKTNLVSFFKALPDTVLDYRYAEGKWTPKEILNHLIDSERIFTYRALRFARQDKTVLSGFDENEFAKESLASNRPIEDLLEEYEMTRASTITLFKSFNSKMLTSKGVAGSGEVSVRSLAFLIIGHEKHHVQIIKERYL